MYLLRNLVINNRHFLKFDGRFLHRLQISSSEKRVSVSFKYARVTDFGSDFSN